jgi:hypothetical protein
MKKLGEEIIRPVPGYEAHYSASTHGRVFSNNYRRTGKMKELAISFLNDKRRSSTTRYVRAKMYFINKNVPTAVHRVIALTFVENPMNLKQVNHKDGDKSNNHASNLEWCTNSQNQSHAFVAGLHTYNKGEDHHNVILTEAQAQEIKNIFKNGNFYKGQLDYLARIYQVSKHCIFDIKRGKSWKHLS